MSEAPTSESNPSQRSRLRRVGLVLAAVFVLYLVAAGLLLPIWLQGLLERTVQEQTGQAPTIEAVRFDPFRLRLAIRGFELAQPAPDRSQPTPGVAQPTPGVAQPTPGVAQPTPGVAQPTPDRARVAFDALEVDLRAVGFLTADVALDEVRLVGPVIEATRRRSGAIDLVDWLVSSQSAGGSDAETEPVAEEGAADEGPSDAGAGEPLIVDVARIRLEGGRIRLWDELREPASSLEIAPLDLTVDDLTTRAEREGRYAIGATLGERTRLLLEGDLGLEPLHSTGRFELQALDLRLPDRHAAPAMRVAVEQGALDASARFELRLEDGLVLELDEGGLALRELAITEVATQRRVLELPDLRVSAVTAQVDSGALRSITIGSVGLQGGRLALRREVDGAIDLARLFAPIEAADAEPSARGGDAVDADRATEADSRVDAGAERAAPTPHASSVDGPPAPRARLERLRVEDFAVDFEDASTPRPVALSLSSIGLEVEGVETGGAAAPFPLSLEAVAGEAGRLAVSGPLQLAPLEATLAIRVEQLELAGFAPYLEPAARLDLAQGRLGTELELRLRTPEAGAESAAPEVFVTGRLAIDDLRAIDRRAGKRFVEWNGLRLEGLDLAPRSLALEEVGIDGLQARVVVEADGRSNLDAIFGDPSGDGEGAGGEASGARATGDAAADAEAAPSDAPFDLRIARIVLDGVGARFADRGSDFSISLDALGGTLEGIASDPAARAEVDLAGRIDGVAPIALKGRLQPLRIRDFADLEIDVRGVSLPTFTPYAARFVGYRIDRGKLDLDLGYQIERHQLVGRNQIGLRQFAFGESVESETATSLPVPLAVALMRDASGDIEIGLPIRGDLDDPGFDFLKLLTQALVGLVTRVVSTPFALVGGLVGAGDQDLEHVLFTPGRSELREEEQAKLELLAQALAERPALRVEIRGRADPAVDGPALARERIEQALRLDAFRALSARERERLGDPAAIELDPRERLEALERLHRERLGARFEDGPDAGSDAGAGPAPATDPVARRAAAILEALAAWEQVGEGEERALAQERALAVQAAFVDRAVLEGDRVYLVDAVLAAAADERGVATELGLSAR